MGIHRILLKEGMIMSLVVAIVNQKGGVAKTTTTFNMGAVLASKGFKTLLIDFDSQASLTIAMGLDPEDFEQSNMGTVLLKEKDITEIVTGVDCSKNLFLAPAHGNLAAAEKIIKGYVACEQTLKRCLSKIRNDYDYILIDCPPTLSDLFINALVACDKVITPCTCDYLAYRGLQSITGLIEEVKECELNNNLEMIGVLITRYKHNVKAQQEVLESIKKEFKVLNTVKETESVSKGIYDGLPVVLNAITPQAKAVAQAYTEVVEEYLLQNKN